MQKITSRSIIWSIAAITAVLLLCPSAFVGDASADEKPAGTAGGDYRIESGDLLHIITWREPNFTMESLVRPDGKITFPLLDDIKAAGRTPVELKHTIQEKLRRFVEEPAVTVIVKAPYIQKFYVLGEVMETGEYPLTRDLTVLQAFAMAGGFTEWASKKKIVLLRRLDGKEKIFNINYKDIVRGKDLSQNLLIQPNDTIIVP